MAAVELRYPGPENPTATPPKFSPVPPTLDSPQATVLCAVFPSLGLQVSGYTYQIYALVPLRIKRKKNSDCLQWVLSFLNREKPCGISPPWCCLVGGSWHRGSLCLGALFVDLASLLSRGSSHRLGLPPVLSGPAS